MTWSWIWEFLNKPRLVLSKARQKKIDATDDNIVGAFGSICSLIICPSVFFYAYYFCIQKLGLLFGLLLGWIPAAILTIISLPIAYVCGPLIFLAGVVYLLKK